MSTYSIYFSPTGGTRKITQLLGKDFSSEKEIDLSKDQDFSKYYFSANDLCIIGVPSFGGRVPAPAIQRINKLQGNNAMALLAAVYGNRAFDDTLLELKDTVKKCGFRPVAAISAVAEHSIMHQFAAGRPDTADEAALHKFAESIRSAIEKDPDKTDICVPGNTPYRKYDGLPLKPRADKTCTRCGLCAASCPVGAIPLDNPSLTDKNVCISCMRCLAVCPNHSRKINKLLVSAASLSMKKNCSTRKENQLYI